MRGGWSEAVTQTPFIVKTDKYYRTATTINRHCYLHKDWSGNLNIIHAPHAGWIFGVLEDGGIQTQPGQQFQPPTPVPTALHPTAKLLGQEGFNVGRGQQELWGQAMDGEDDTWGRGHSQSNMNLGAEENQFERTKTFASCPLPPSSLPTQVLTTHKKQ